MKLHEIIEISEQGTSGILIEIIAKYKKSLLTYFKEYYNCEPILIVTTVFNAAQYGFIAPSNEICDAIYNYVDSMNLETEEDRQNEIELISFQSIPLNKL
jgi:hypothetical protein